MRSKNSELMNNIVEFINREYFDSGRTPTMQEIATAFGISKGCVSNYIAEMQEKGMLENSGTCRGVRTKKMEKLQQAVEYLPVVGSIACGTPTKKQCILGIRKKPDISVRLSKQYSNFKCWFLQFTFARTVLQPKSERLNCGGHLKPQKVVNLL